jgi:two-component system, OmpR family, sensor histidine kinase MprB
MSLRLRLAVLVAGTVAIAIGGAAAGALVTARGELRAKTDAFLLERGTAIVSATDPGRPGMPTDLGSIGAETDGSGRPPHGPRVRFGGQNRIFAGLDAVTQVVTASGRAGSFGGQPALPVDARDRALAADGGRPRLRDVIVAEVPYRMVTMPFPGVGALQVARTQQENEAILTGLRTRMTLGGLAGSCLAAAAGWLLARRFTRPIEALTGAAEHVAYTEDLAAPIRVERDDEVGRLAASFNAMLAALRSSREQQQRLVMDASHELRTPLTSLRTNLELLERAPDLDRAERQALLADVNAELRELGDLVVELVELATERRLGDDPTQPTALAELVSGVVARDTRRYRREIRLRVDNPPAVADLQPTMMERAIHNLLDNAAKFSPGGTPIEVRVRGGTVEVRDHGPGIQPADLDRVFDRFYRGPSARTLPGSGLGLAIVKEVVEAHSGTVHAAPAAGGGTVVGFTLPQSSAAG